MGRSAIARVSLVGLMLLPLGVRRMQSGQDEGEATRYWMPEAEAPVYVNPAGTVEATYMFGEEGDPAYWGLIALNPGGEVPPHSHDVTEYLYVLSGLAKFVAGDRTTIVRTGTAIRIPAGVIHSARNDGPEPLRAVQAYVPRGPEVRFKSWRRRN